MHSFAKQIQKKGVVVVWAKIITAVAKYGTKAVKWAWAHKKQIVEVALTVAEAVDYVLRHMN